MQRFNIMIMSPVRKDDLVHLQCFLEVAQLLRYGLEDLGHQVGFAKNLQKDCTNILLAYHILEDRRLPEGYDCIIYQLEELYESCETPLERMLNTLRSNCKIWDFNQQNVAFLRQNGIHATYKPLGFHPKMARIQHHRQKDVDILFYGSKNERRMKILNALDQEFNVKILFGVYGQERDEWIARSKIVLSIYYYETKYFDDVRMSYLLTNRVFTIVEDTPHKRYQDFLIYAPYDSIVETCRYYLQNDELRQRLAQETHQAFSQYPETEFLRQALNAMT
ncbi:MAG: hypothetical protein ACE5IY_17365 [bacterium]